MVGTVAAGNNRREPVRVRECKRVGALVADSDLGPPRTTITWILDQHNNDDDDGNDDDDDDDAGDKNDAISQRSIRQKRKWDAVQQGNYIVTSISLQFHI